MTFLTPTRGNRRHVTCFILLFSFCSLSLFSFSFFDRLLFYLISKPFFSTFSSCSHQVKCLSISKALDFYLFDYLGFIFLFDFYLISTINRTPTTTFFFRPSDVFSVLPRSYFALSLFNGLHLESN